MNVVTYRHGTDDLLRAVEGPCERYGIRCTDVTGDRSAPAANLQVRMSALHGSIRLKGVFNSYTCGASRT